MAITGQSSHCGRRWLSRNERYSLTVFPPSLGFTASYHCSANFPKGVSPARGSIHTWRRMSASCSSPHFFAAVSEEKPDLLPRVPSGLRYRDRHPLGPSWSFSPHAVRDSPFQIDDCGDTIQCEYPHSRHRGCGRFLSEFLARWVNS